jgi:RimJ/RimL family protein N-acetyltransferase
MLTNLRQETVVPTPMARLRVRAADVAPSRMTDWRQVLPVLSNGVLTLRELRVSDAEALLELLTNEEVSRFISPPPTTVEGFERFIAWAHRERAAGRYICFAVVPQGMDTAIGIFQVRQLDPTFTAAEWGFAIGRAFWGSGVFGVAARMTIEFSFETVGIHRLEARAAVANGRGNGALAKLGAVKEAILRRSFLRDGRRYDQTLWSIVREDWRRAKAVWGAAVH